ncbi:MAG TPA: hypothetical protein VGD83_00175, partial [Streptosporangiaceae bacterium]
SGRHQGAGRGPAPATHAAPPLTAAYGDHGKGHLPALLQRPVEPKAFWRSESPIPWRPAAGDLHDQQKLIGNTVLVVLM